MSVILKRGENDFPGRLEEWSEKDSRKKVIEFRCRLFENDGSLT